MLQGHNLAKGEKINGFEILEIVPVEEMKATGIYARHIKSGCEVFHILNDDPENLFGFAFATQPENSKGTAHILEHSVLCGSEKFPLKDPFVVLCRQSIKTFLNAMTYPDKTVYPASSTVESDYFNLMAVYGDAVFFPLLEEWTFLQEGHRFEMQDDGKLSIQGVVFNEMKGNYSSFDSVAGDWTVRSLFEGTSYGYDSGGEPECIPDLTFEEFKAFHKKYYHPSNCRIFLYGNIATEKQFEFLDSRFLSKFEQAEPVPLPPLPERWNEPRVVRKPAPPGDMDEGEDKLSVSLNWLLPETCDASVFMKACLLEEILLGHDGSPLSKALLDSGLGEDILPSNGLEADMRLLCFSAGLRGVNGKNAGKVEKVILDTLSGIVENGIPQKELETAVRSMDFLNREIRRGSGPFSLVLMSRSLRGWLRGKTPWETMRYIPVFEKLKADIAGRPEILTDLIRDWFLENNHRTLLSVYPDKEWSSRQETAFQEKIRQFELSSGLKEEENRRIFLEKQKALFEKQMSPESPENLALIPHLAPKDLPPPYDELPCIFSTFGKDAVMMTHEQNVNGITYADFFFPVDTLSPEDYPFLPFFTAAFSNVGLSGLCGQPLTWAEAASESAGLFGGIGVSLYVSSPVSGARLPTPFKNGDAGRDFLVFRIKMLEELSDEAFKFALRIVRSADFSDTKRIKTLFSEYMNDLESSIVPSGHQYASSRASVGASRARAVDELWNGFSQIRFIRGLSGKKQDLNFLSRKLEELRSKITGSGVFVHLTGTETGLKKLSGCVLSLMKDFSGLAPANPECRDASTFFKMTDAGSGFVDNTGSMEFETVYSEMQVGFSAMALPAPPYPDEMNAAVTVLGHWFSNGPLWEKIRTTGGAYGVFAYPDSLENVFVFSSYRDPGPVRSLSVFASALAEASSLLLSREETDSMITGCYSREIKPRTPCDRAFTDCIRFLYGITGETRKTKLRFMKSLTPEKLKEAAEFLRENLGMRKEVAVGTKKIIKLAEKSDFCGNIRNYII